MNNFIFITGGVLSSLGKGITAASVGALLKSMGYSITFLKLDPYLNIDPGTMSPSQHGEVFVTEDGAETDLDLGHYERFAHANLSNYNCVTAGKMYTRLLEKERKGVFLGATIQVIPHLTTEIKSHFYAVAENVDITIIEIGGTVGDIESLPFLEAARQMRLDRSKAQCLYVHLTYVPYITAAGELKTKPTQHSIRELSSLGIQPDIIIGRSEKALPTEIKKKISLFTNVEERSIFSSPDLKSIYQVPLYFHNQGLDKALVEYLDLPYKEPCLQKWINFDTTFGTLKKTATIVIVGKYIELKDAYKSLMEALIHAQVATQIGVDIHWVDAQTVTMESSKQQLGHADGIIVPGGFGCRGVEGKIAAAHYARNNQVPYLGICLGMQVIVIEFARYVLGLNDAHSTEFDPETKHPVITLMPDQRDKEAKGGTMRLGSFSCALTKNTRAHHLYQSDNISERHRHRYEVNPDFEALFTKKGLVVSGVYKERNLTEIVEIPSHPYFIGCQFHPELKSKPFDPHPLFTAFVKASFDHTKNKKE